MIYRNRDVSLEATTNGNGCWSSRKKLVRITQLELIQFDADPIFGNTWNSELRVFFNKADWDINEDGLIYSDGGFLEDLEWLLNHHFDVKTGSIEYSEQGMQGKDYVSFDAQPGELSKVFL